MATNALVKATTNALTKNATKSLTKGVEKAVTKGVTNALAKTATKSATSALTKTAGKGVTNALTKGTTSTLNNLVSKASSNAGKALAKTAGSLADDVVLGSSSSLSSKIAPKLADKVDDIVVKTAPTAKIADSVPDLMNKTAKSSLADKVDDIAKAVTPAKSAIALPASFSDDVAKVAPKSALATATEMADNAPAKLAEAVTAPEAVAPVAKTTENIALEAPEKLSKVASTTGMDDVADTTASSALKADVAELKEKLRTATGGAGGSVPPTTPTTAGAVTPGSDGFNVKLKDGRTADIRVGSATGATKQQSAMRKLDDRVAKGFNPTAKQYGELMERSKSADGHYRTVASRLKAENMSQANVATKTRAVLDHIEGVRNEALAMMDEAGAKIDLSGIEKAVGLSPTQKKKLAELGLSLDDIAGEARMLSPTQAEEVYKVLSDYAYNWSDSKDAATAMAGKAMKKEAEAVSKAINDVMDNSGIDFKLSYIDGLGMDGAGVDGKYLKHISERPDFKFSDLRREESDWITMGRLSGRPIKEDPAINVLGVDTGIPNPAKKISDWAKEKFYERRANAGAGAGGVGGGIPPVGSGGLGAENKINLIGGNAGGGLLGNLKGAGLVGAGVLGGLLLGGGGSGSSDNTALAGDTSTLAQLGVSGMSEPASTEPTLEETVSNMTIGGYSYEQLENGYMSALMAGDTNAAKVIASMMDALNEKVDRYYTLKKNSDSGSDSSGIAGKQRAAMNVLSTLMNNFEAKGVVGGNLSQFANWITGGGYDPKQFAYDTGAKGSLGTIIKALGDTGALSEGDQQRALSLLPSTKDSPEAAKMKYQQLMSILQGAGAQ